MLVVAGSNPVSRSLLKPLTHPHHIANISKLLTPGADRLNVWGSAGVAQLVEHKLAMLVVAGSNPVSRSQQTPSATYR